MRAGERRPAMNDAPRPEPVIADPPRADLGQRQSGAGAVRAGARGARRGAGLDRRLGARAGRGRAAGHRGRGGDRLSRKCSTGGSRPCIRRCMAACWRGATGPIISPRSPRTASARSTSWSATSTRSPRRWPSGADRETCIENIDIGGPALIRAAAKNHEFVTVVTDPADYDTVLGEIASRRGRPRAAAASGAQGLCADRRL